MRSRHRNEIDADSRIMEALGAEARTLAQINREENEEKLRELPGPSQTVSYSLLYKDYTNIIKNYYEQRCSNRRRHHGHIPS